jgi:hypothetical protein
MNEKQFEILMGTLDRIVFLLEQMEEKQVLKTYER